MDLKDSCRKLTGESSNAKGFEDVLRGALGKDVKDIGIGGKGALDKINTEGKERIWRHELELDGVDSSEDNGRSQGIEGIGTKGDGGFHGVGRLNCHMHVLH